MSYTLKDAIASGQLEVNEIPPEKYLNREVRQVKVLPSKGTVKEPLEIWIIFIPNNWQWFEIVEGEFQFVRNLQGYPLIVQEVKP